MQTPSLHARPAIATCGSMLQSLPHAPQLWISFVETHPAAHLRWPATHPPLAEEASSPPSSGPASPPSPLPASADADPSEDDAPDEPPSCAVVASPGSFDADPVDEKSPRIAVHPATGAAKTNAKIPRSPRHDLIIDRLRPRSPTSASGELIRTRRMDRICPDGKHHCRRRGAAFGSEGSGQRPRGEGRGRKASRHAKVRGAGAHGDHPETRSPLRATIRSR